MKKQNQEIKAKGKAKIKKSSDPIIFVERKPKKASDPHAIGIHGAVFFVTQQGYICAECSKPVKFNP